MLICSASAELEEVENRRFCNHFISLELRCPTVLLRIKGRRTSIFKSGNSEELIELPETYHFLLTIQLVEISNISSPEIFERL